MRINLIVSDQRREWRARVDAEIAMGVLAALSADPLTLEELKRAAGRYMAGRHQDRLFRKQRRADESPLKSGDFVVDLAARVIVGPWQKERPDFTFFLNEEGKFERLMYFDLRDDWKCVGHDADWQALVEDRRANRQQFARTLDRELVYGETLFQFLAECTKRQLADGAPQDASKIVQKVHADWMNFVPEGYSASIRSLVLADEAHLEAELMNRAVDQCSSNLEPAGLDPRDAAYQTACFGTNELRVYGRLIRHLVSTLVDELRDQDQATSSAIHINRLATWSEEWMKRADIEGLMGRTPSEVIDLQRRRIPLATAPGEVLDCDCPLCRLTADEPDAPPAIWFVPAARYDLRLPFRSTLSEPPQVRLEYASMRGPGQRFSTIMQDNDMFVDEEVILCSDDDEDEAWASGDRAADPLDAMDVGALDLGSTEFGQSDSPSRWGVFASAASDLSDTTMQLFAVAASIGGLIRDLKAAENDRDANRPRVDALNEAIDRIGVCLHERDEKGVDASIRKLTGLLDEIAVHYPEWNKRIADVQAQAKQLILSLT